MTKELPSPSEAVYVLMGSVSVKAGAALSEMARSNRRRLMGVDGPPGLYRRRASRSGNCWHERTNSAEVEVYPRNASTCRMMKRVIV